MLGRHSMALRSEAVLEHDQPNLEARIQQLSNRLREVERRLAAIESGGRAPFDATDASGAVAPSPGGVGERPRVGEAVQLVGRTLAEVHGRPADEVARITTRNARAFFRLDSA